MSKQFPVESQKNILHSTLTKDNLVLMASDIVQKAGYIKGNTISLTLNCSTEKEIKTFFTNLSKDGEILDHLQEQFWGATFGSIIDKYGINWLLNYEKSN
jgi:PhnB protein